MAADDSFLQQLLDMDQAVWAEKKLAERFVLPQAYVTAGMIGLGLGLISQWIRSDFKPGIPDFVTVLETMMPPLLTDPRIFKADSVEP